MPEEQVRLMKPLFYDGMFNHSGRKMRSIFLKEISNGTDTYRLWRRSGTPDVKYPHNEKDKYILHVELNGYLVSLQMSEFGLIECSGHAPAIESLYGGAEQRHKYFSELRSGTSQDIGKSAEAIRREDEMILQFGSDPAYQANYIRAQLDSHIEMYKQAKENGGKTFPDFIGALLLDDIPACLELRINYGDVLREKEEARRAQQRAEDIAAVKNGKLEAEKMVSAALDIIRHGGILKNERIKIYTLTADSYTVADYALVNYLMRQYKVDASLRTQGWVNNMMTDAAIEDGQCVSVRFLHSKRGKGSQKVFDCMDALIKAVCSQWE